MKIKQILIIMLCIGIFCIGINLKSVNAEAQLQSRETSNQLRVISSNTMLRRGETGTITIGGKANTRYIIKTSYVLGDREISVSQMRLADENGEATFNWVVDRKTALGTRKAIIYGGGETIELTHTVVE
jgi:alpha-D-ribose 1-methylphosphonate 5-triphosphate synthase subunit PhnG